MTYLKYNVDSELKKFLRNQPTKVAPEVLLRLIVDDYLAQCSRRNDG
jgi:hypothetical protein